MAGTVRWLMKAPSGSTSMKLRSCRNPVASRPPAPYRRTYLGDYFEIWERDDGAPEVREHLPLGDDNDPSGPVDCAALRERSGLGTVALSGGVFQNLLLLGQVVDGLEESGFRVLTHARVPPNDGGISLGQAAVAGARDRRSGR